MTKKSKIIVISIVSLLTIIIGILLLKKPQDNANDIVTKVGLLVEFPSTENPSVATVSDVEKLKSQDFFKRAKNGDKVLIFQSVKKAILYRPSTNKIIDITIIAANK